MSTYTDKDLENLKDLVKENNKILRRLNRRSNVSVAYQTVKWIVVIGVAIGAYTLLQPFFMGVSETYNSIRDNISSITSG